MAPAKSASSRGRSKSPAPSKAKASSSPSATAASPRSSSRGRPQKKKDENGDGSASSSTTKTPAKEYAGITHNSADDYEFGGPWGVFALMLWSHYILFYFWYCLAKFDGKFQWIVDDIPGHWRNFTTAFFDPEIGCVPQGPLFHHNTLNEGYKVIAAYIAFFVAQIVLAAIVPGLMMDGLPTKDGKRLKYLCNGYLCYYICLWGLLVVDYFDPITMQTGWGKGIFPLTHIHDHFGKYLFVSTVIGDLTSVLWYIYGIVTPQPEASSGSGNVVYDFFMGSVLYPRFGIVDIKMIAECRWSWLTLFMLTLSCAVAQMGPERDIYKISPSMWMMLLAHWLYSNATVKGEHYIPGTWDMFHEKFGWMLNFWNITGVPFLYCFQSFYIERNQAAITAFASQFTLPFLPSVNVYYVLIFAMLIIGYYIFDTANCQKASCKLPGIKRELFPHMPWGILENPHYIKTPKGNLLCDGWYQYARKMQYTGDILMALSWAMACGFALDFSDGLASLCNPLLPYFYVVFFTCMITHRQSRDEIRCKEKYGKHWDEYTSIVPNVFVPDAAFFQWLFTGKEKSRKAVSKR